MPPFGDTPLAEGFNEFERDWIFGFVFHIYDLQPWILKFFSKSLRSGSLE